MRLYFRDIQACKEPWAKPLHHWLTTITSSHQLKYGVVMNSLYVDLKDLAKYSGIYLFDMNSTAHRLTLDLLYPCCPDLKRLKQELVWPVNVELDFSQMNAEHWKVVTDYHLTKWGKFADIPQVAYAIPYGFMVYLNKPEFSGVMFECDQTVQWNCALDVVSDLLYTLVILIIRLRMAPVNIYLPREWISVHIDWKNTKFLGYSVQFIYNRLVVVKC